MRILKLTLILFTLAITGTSYGQQNENSTNFHGAVATLKSYKVLYILNQSDDKKIKAVLRNIKNALEDPRLKGKLTVELVVFGDGVEVFKKANHYDTLLLKLQDKGVVFAQCENTIRERGVSKDALWPFIGFVPSGNGEIIIRQYQGWATLHP